MLQHILAAISLCAAVGLTARADEEPTIRPDVVYGHKDGMALTFDVIAPSHPNGAGVLFIQSGGWYSVWTEPKTLLPACAPLLAKGITVFIVRHASAPKYTIPEILPDVRRSVRFVRSRAKEFGVDPERLGVLGGSAGGHLTLMLATTGDEGDPKAADPVLRESSRVAAAVAMYPPTDLRDWVSNPPEAIRKTPGLKPPLSFEPAKAPACSPALLVTPTTSPTLLIHGDKDELVPVAHSRQMIAALKENKVPSDLLVIEGAGHSFTAPNYAIAVPAMVAWFERYLIDKKQ